MLEGLPREPYSSPVWIEQELEQIQVHLNKLECHGKVHFSNSTQIVKLVY